LTVSNATSGIATSHANSAVITQVGHGTCGIPVRSRSGVASNSRRPGPNADASPMIDTVADRRGSKGPSSAVTSCPSICGCVSQPLVVRSVPATQSASYTSPGICTRSVVGPMSVGHANPGTSSRTSTRSGSDASTNGSPSIW
jgi:hypothetical protein